MTKRRKKPGRLVVIEGSDGSGKATQSRLLARRLCANGVPAERIAFPGYKRSFFGRMAGAYLRGEYGGMDRVDPRLAAVLYAADRWEAREKIGAWLREGKVVVCDRYVASNKAHQAARLPAAEDPEAFLRWIDRLEYQVFRMPRPDRVVFLHVPHDVADGLIAKKGRRAYLKGERRDAHESDAGHLRRAQEMYERLASKTRSGRVVRIECVENGALLPKSQIADRVYAAVARVLGPIPRKRLRSRGTPGRRDVFRTRSAYE